MKKDLEDLERFGKFLGAADWKRVCLTAQKSYKSEQIEQINVDEKRFGRFGRFGKICEIYSPDGSSTRLGAADWKRVSSQ